MTPWGKVLLEKLKDPQLDKKLPTFYGTICFQQSITYSCPEPDKSSPHPPNLFMVHFNIILPSIPRPSKHSLSFMFSNKNPVCITLLPHTCYMPRLPLIIRTISGEECRSLSSYLCNFLYSSFTYFLLGTNILLNTLFSNTLSQLANVRLAF